MKLYGTSGSPFARKVRIVLAEKNIACDYIVARASTPDSPVPPLNPLAKIPTLVRDDGRALYDSPVIVEYLRKAGCLVARLSGPGIPDLLVGHRGRWLLMEVKAEGGRMKEGQVTFHDAAQALNLPCYVVYSVEDCQRILRKWARVSGC